MSQNESILKYLKKGYSLTGLKALHLFKTMKLATRLSELRNQGYKIKSEFVIQNNKRFKEYWM